VELEIYADVVCPWCYIGKIRMEKALAAFDGELTVRMRPFQLDPHAPSDGQPLLAWLGPRYGGPGRARQVMAHVTSVAEAEGLHLNFDRALIANTFDAHRLLWFADRPDAVVFGAGPDTQADLADVLFRAHFADGLDLGSTDVLIELAESLDLDGQRVCQLLTSTEGVADVRAQIAAAHDLGITSVPTFVAAGRHAVTGAQSAGTLSRFLAEVVRREGLAPTPQNLVPGQRTASAYNGDSRVN
jgi:predicted DsbA family dithiol-disulfide isomerase